VPDGSVAELLKTPERNPLHLVMFLQNGKLSGVYVVGDTVAIGVPSRSVESGIFTLIAAYYVFNVDYPKQYAMFFGILQSLVLEQPYLKATTKKYAFLLKKLRKAMQEVPATSEEDDDPPRKKRAVESRVIGDSTDPASKQAAGECVSQETSSSRPASKQAAGERVSQETVSRPASKQAAGERVSQETVSRPASKQAVGERVIQQETSSSRPQRTRRAKNKKFDFD